MNKLLILLFILIFSFLSFPQSWWNTFGKVGGISNRTPDTTWTILTEFIQCKKDSQLITNEIDRTFEAPESTNWISYNCYINSNLYYEGTYDYGYNEFGGGESESFTLSESFIGEPLDGTVFDVKDSLIIQFYYYLTGTNFDPSRIFSPYILTLPIAESWTQINIVRCPPRSVDSSYAIVFDFIEQNFSSWAVAIDNVSMIWRRNFTCYQSITTEPISVKVDEVVYEKSNGTKEYTASSKWSYSDGVLYIGVDPANKTIKVTY